MKILRVVISLCLLLTSLVAIYLPAAALAQEEPPEESIEFVSTYPTVENISGSTFEFEVDLKYQGELGSEARVFELVTTAPQGWSVYITPQYETGKRIKNIRLEPGFSTGTKVKVTAISPVWPPVEPGEYKIKLEAISDEIKGSTEFTAVVTAKYDMYLVSATERLNTTTKAGKDNYFSIEVQNLGTAAIDNINFSSTKSTGWAIDFSPEKIDSLAAIDYKTVELNIKPPAEAIAGDYRVTIRASGEQASESIELRVTVETPAIWGWVGVAIIVLVIAGLAYVFMRFSRR